LGLRLPVVALWCSATTSFSIERWSFDALEAAGLRNKVKVMISGAPVTQIYAEQIGADGYGPDASSAVRLAKSLMGAR